MKIKSLIQVAAVFCFLPFGTVARAGSLSANSIAIFPKNVAEFAYADLKEARKFKWYAQFKLQTLPARFVELEQFLETSGIQPTQIDELAWALGAGDERAEKTGNDVPSAERLVGLAMGHFEVESVKRAFKVRKLAGVERRGYTLYPCGAACQDLVVVFLDSDTLAFGQRELVERLIEVRSGAEESLVQNEKIFPLINQINGSGIFWGVLGAGGTRQAIHQMIPEASEFPGAGKLLNKMNAMVISLEGSSELEGRIQLVSTSPEAAVTVSQLLQAGLLYREYQARESNPELVKALETVRVAPTGSGLEVSFTVTNDQIMGLINQNTFTRKM